MGIPYYGYDWPVEKADEFMSNTLDQNDQNGYVEVLSYSRMRKDPLFNSPDNCTWDELAQAPWCWHIDEKTNIALMLIDMITAAREIFFICLVGPDLNKKEIRNKGINILNEW